MIRFSAEGGSGGRPCEGDIADAPFLLLEDPLSRASDCPHIAYALPCEGPSGDVWRVAGLYPDLLSFDEGGWEALRLGAWYYHRGMSYSDARSMDERVRCFQAAEILYLHSAAQGNLQALVNLGYVYGYNRCEGRFWPGWEKHDRGDYSSFPAEERAYQVLEGASAGDFPEALYKLGDMLSAGRGCVQDRERAFSCYSRAYGLAEFEDPVIVGSCAIRLAGCYEEGKGCEQDFQEALAYYEEAQSMLEAAVAMGEGYYRGVLRRARSGAVRMRQEICGGY